MSQTETFYRVRFLIEERQVRTTTVDVLYSREPEHWEIDRDAEEIERVVFGLGVESLDTESEEFTVSQGDWSTEDTTVMFSDVESY
jgi:hypothetical protein